MIINDFQLMIKIIVHQSLKDYQVQAGCGDEFTDAIL